MNVIKTHAVTLYGGNDADIILRPLSDEHLPLLYKWNADPAVVYWSDASDVTGYDEAGVRGIYGAVSQSALCFLIEVDGVAVGECWLQPMNIPALEERHPGKDVRRIDIMIGEKICWGRGIGTAVIGMLVDFGFYGAQADVLYALVEDYNQRSQRAFMKNGFALALVREQPRSFVKARAGHCYMLRREDFMERRRVHVPRAQQFLLPVCDLQPSQLFISAGKLRLVQTWFSDKSPQMDPIPVVRLGGRIVMTDGHTRAVAAHLAGLQSVPVYCDGGSIDRRAYEMDVRWCDEEGVRSPADLADRVVSHVDYERLWRRRCMEMTPE